MESVVFKLEKFCFSKMTKFIFVRHGQSQTNIEQRFTGQMDSPLSEKAWGKALRSPR